MTSPNPSPTRSTTKANSYLLARRQERRNLNTSIDSEGKERDETYSSIDNEDLTEGNKNLGPSSPNPNNATNSSETQRQDQAEKAYHYLTQRRAKRRLRSLVTAHPPPEHNTETAPTAINSSERELVNPPPTITPRTPDKMTEPQRLIVLVSKGVSDRTQASNQSRAMTLLLSKGAPFVEVDGMDPNQKERRNELFAISGIRACYPQFFLERKDGTTTFVGTWDVLEGINDSSSYSEETIEAYPELRTWDRVFANLVESFE